ncbi:MAG: cytochrome c biogenesis protein CcsA [Acidobacteria bacterium]|nr:cytochrome c biogenesis protein CcsA [Acidobacteriota bacterium]
MIQFVLNIALALYVLGLLHSLLGFYAKRPLLYKIASGTVGTGFLVHTLALVLLWAQEGHFPLTRFQEALSFFAWAVTLGFFLSYLKYRINVLGAFILPLVSSLMLSTCLLWEERLELPEGVRGTWVAIHTILILLAYAAFFLTFVSALMYLLQERELKTKRPSIFYFRLPSLQQCEDLLYRSLMTGFPLMTLGLLMGTLWSERILGRFWSWDPKEIAAAATWLIYLVLIQYRFTQGWRGRRVAYGSILGFISVLFTFLGSSYLGGGYHTF